jgi:hypothetical protein
MLQGCCYGNWYEIRNFTTDGWFLRMNGQGLARTKKKRNPAPLGRDANRVLRPPDAGFAPCSLKYKFTTEGERHR